MKNQACSQLPLLLMVLVLTVAFGGCAPGNSAGYEASTLAMSASDEPSVVSALDTSIPQEIKAATGITVESQTNPVTLDTETLTLRLTNRTDAEIYCGESYQIQFLKDGIWKDMPWNVANLAFPAIAYIVGPGESRDLNFSLLVIDRAGGQYRVVFDVLDQEKQKIQLAVAFEIE